MIAAVYARKSTDQSAVADEAKSVRRQVEHARAYAARRGWTVDERFLFVDDGISGAEFEKRPALMRLLNSLSPRPSFQALIMSEESRLGREMVQTLATLQQLVRAGVRVFYYLEDRERTLDSPIEKVMAALESFGAELERDKNRQRAYDKAMSHARAGHVTGGRCFGYDNLEVRDAGGRRSHVEQRVNESQAGVVRRVFELAASGLGQKAIAKQLNAEGLSAPESQQDRPRAWIQSSVHAVLHRERYRGEVVFNKTRKRDSWGQRRSIVRATDEWIRVDAPHLRIVSEELWEAAHGMIAKRRSSCLLRSARERDSKYLLPGLARCEWCGGGMQVRTRTRASGQRAGFYACTSHFDRGASVCRNVVQYSMDAIDRAVIDEIQELLTPELIDDVLSAVRAELEPARRDDPRERITTELEAIASQQANLTEAIAMGGQLPALVARLHTLEERRQELARAQTMLGDGPMVRRVNWKSAERQARGLLADWRALLGRNIGQETRAFLREYLIGPIRFTPILEPGRRGYRFEGAVSIGGILAGTVMVGSMASPGGLEPPAYRLGGGRSIH